MKFAVAALACACLSSFPATAQGGDRASARNPAGLIALLTAAGYAPTLGTDSTGDPMIDLLLAEYQATILFYDCDEAHKNCGSLQLRVGFDRDNPWTAAEALAVSKKYRFASMWLDGDGDPWVQWDVMTGEGIPAKVFLDSVSAFSDTVEDIAEIVFEND